MPILNVENIASTTEITENGLHDVAQYTTADVNVSPSITSLNVTPTTSAQTITAPAGTDGYSPVNVSAVTSSIDANITAGNIKDGVTILGVTGNYQGGGGTQTLGLLLVGEVVNGQFQKTSQIKTVGITSVGEAAFGMMFQDSNLVTTDPLIVDLSSLTEITEDEACQAMFGTTGVWAGQSEAHIVVDMRNVVQITGYGACDGMFGYSPVTTVNLQSLETIGYESCKGMFEGTQLESVSFSSLTFIDGCGLLCCFGSCEHLTEISFPALTTSSFGGTDALSDLLMGDSDVTLHFPSNIQSEVEGLDGYPDFGGNNTTLLFDLTATS